jgi:hypothetical protein
VNDKGSEAPSNTGGLDQPPKNVITIEDIQRELEDEYALYGLTEADVDTIADGRSEEVDPTKIAAYERMEAARRQRHEQMVNELWGRPFASFGKSMANQYSRQVGQALWQHHGTFGRSIAAATSLSDLMGPLGKQLSTSFNFQATSMATAWAKTLASASTVRLVSDAINTTVPTVRLDWLGQIGAAVVESGVDEGIDAFVAKDATAAAAVHGAKKDASSTEVSPELVGYGVGFIVWVVHLAYVLSVSGHTDLAQTLITWVKEGMIDGLLYAWPAKTVVTARLRGTSNESGG